MRYKLWNGKNYTFVKIIWKTNINKEYLLNIIIWLSKIYHQENIEKDPWELKIHKDLYNKYQKSYYQERFNRVIDVTVSLDVGFRMLPLSDY